MAPRVTNAVTKHGRVYAAGEIIDNPTPREDSMGRLFKWETVSDPAPSLAGLRKPQLVQLAAERGLDVEGLTKNELIEALED